jgi:hypothetical protein
MFVGIIHRMEKIAFSTIVLLMGNNTGIEVPPDMPESWKVEKSH